MGSWDRLEIERPELVNQLTTKSVKDLSQELSVLNPTKDELSIALCMSVASHDVDRSLFLLQSGADPNWQDGSALISLGNGPSGFGFGQTSCMLFDVLHEFGVEMDRNQVALKLAVDNGNHLLVDRIFESGMSDKLLQGAAVSDAARNDDVQMIALLHKHGCINSEYANEAFCCAAEEGAFGVMEFMADKIDRNTLGHDALERATYFGEFKSVDYLIDVQKFSINEYDNSFVQTALMSNNKELIEKVITGAEKPYKLISDENIQHSILLEHPEMMDKLLSSIEKYNKTVFDNSNETFKQKIMEQNKDNRLNM